MAQTPLSEIDKYNQMLKDRAASIVAADPPMALRNPVENIKSPFTGEIYQKPTEDVDYENDLVLGVNTEFPGIKYGIGAEAKTAAETTANLLTLGGFEQIRAPFLDSEDKKEILERQKYTQLGSGLATAGTFLFPWTKLGAIGEIAGAVPTFGTRAFEAIGGTTKFKTVAALSAQGAIDTATASFAAGTAQNALDDFHQENVFVDALKDSLFGATFGAALGAFVKPTPILKGEGALVPTAEVAAVRPTVKELKNIPSIPQDLIDAKANSANIGKNAIGWSKFVSEYAPLLEHPDGRVVDVNTLSLDDRLKRDFYDNFAASVFADKQLIQDYFVTGVKNFDDHWNEVKNAYEVGRKYGTEGRPIKRAIDNIYEPTIRGAMTDLIAVRRMRGAFETEFNPEVLNSTLPKEEHYSLAADSVVGDNSFLAKNLRDLNETIARAETSASVERYVKNLAPDYLQQLGRDLRAAAEDVGMVTEKAEALAALGIKSPLVSQASPSQIYRFITRAEEFIGTTYGNAKTFKIRAGQKPNAEAALYGKLKSELDLLKKRFDGYAPKDAEITEVIKTMNRADDALRTVLGVGKTQKKEVVVEGKFAKDQSLERGLISRDAFDKYRAYNDSTGKSSLAEVKPTIENYFNTLESGFQKFGELTGKDMTSFIERIRLNKERATLAMNERDIISKQSLNRWYKWQKKITGEGEKTTGKGLASNRVRINRIIHDLFATNFGAASRQTLALVTDNLLGIAEKLKNTNAIDAKVELQIAAMAKIREAGNKGQQLSDSFVSKLVKGISLKSEPSKLVSILPYQMRKLSKDDRDKVNNEFRKVSKTLFDLTANPERIYKMVEANRSLNDLSAGVGDRLNEKMILTLNQLQSIIPQGAPESQGGGPPPLIDQAKFLDTVTAITDPYKTLELMLYGAVTQEMVDVMKRTSPEIYANAARKVQLAITNNPDISLKSRTKIQSLFPMLNATVRPVPGAQPYSAITPPPQEAGDQNAPAMPRGGLARTSGPNKLNANKQVGTFTTQGAP